LEYEPRFNEYAMTLPPHPLESAKRFSFDNADHRRRQAQATCPGRSGDAELLQFIAELDPLHTRRQHGEVMNGEIGAACFVPLDASIHVPR
jgi:hypothetical protein